MQKKEMKSLAVVRRALKKEIKRIDKVEGDIGDLKKPHAIASGYLDHLKERRREAKGNLQQIEAAMITLKTTTSPSATPAVAKRASKRSEAGSSPNRAPAN